MNLVTIINPPKLVFGEKSLEQFIADFEILGLKRLYLVTIEPLEAQLLEQLEPLKTTGVEIKVNKSILKEPTFDDFELLLREARDFQADSVVGIGGGSVLDVAKLIAVQVKSSQSTSEIIGIRNIKGRSTYLACIPTTSGTGSEVSPNAIFVDDKGAKIGVISPYLVPDASYLDPALTVGVPSSVTAATGIDALTHNLEAYINNFAHPLIDPIALEGIRLIAKYLRRACANGKDIEARSQLALGSMYGGMCLGPVNTAAVHALSYPLSVSYHVPHGLSVALLLPAVMEFNITAAPARHAQVAIAMGAAHGNNDLETARMGIALIRNLISDCRLPLSLDELNIPYKSIPKMAEDAMKVQRLLKNNVRTITQKDAENIYRASFRLI